MTEFAPSSAVRADTLLAALDGIPTKLRGAMDLCGWETVGDVLAHLPRRYEDRRSFSRFPADPTDEPVTIRVTPSTSVPLSGDTLGSQFHCTV